MTGPDARCPDCGEPLYERHTRAGGQLFLALCCLSVAVVVGVILGAASIVERLGGSPW